MARTPLIFQTAFDDVCNGIGSGLTAADVAANASLQAKLLRIFNRSYNVGLNLNGAGWEDARTGAEITPVARLIEFSVLGDAREFEVWTEDPRDDEVIARKVAHTVNNSGILLREDLDTVWVEWMPEVVTFVLTAWTTTNYAVGDRVLINSRNYRCLEAHTGGVFADDLTASKWVLLPVLGILHEFLIMHSLGLYEIEAGNTETGYRIIGTAKRELSELAVREMDRQSIS